MSTRLWITPAELEKEYPRPVRLWVSDFGEIRLPDDFPAYIFRNDGWFDKRFKALREKWESWIAVEETILRMEHFIPNRLRGAAINARGEAT